MDSRVEGAGPPLPRRQFTIGRLILGVGSIGLALAALRDSSALSENLVFGATAFVLLMAILLAIHSSGRSRAFWLGFALFGSAYFAAAQAPAFERRLPTGNILRSLVYRFSHWRVDTTEPSDAVRAQVFTPDGSSRPEWNVYPARPRGRLLAERSTAVGNAVRIGHWLLSLVTGLLGGLYSTVLARSGPKRGGGANGPGSSDQGPVSP